jgi:NADPH:quinone reductase
MRAVVVNQYGGPEVLHLDTDAPEPSPGDGEVLLDVTSAGVNFADTHQAENSYIVQRHLPMIPGAEAVGTLGDGSRVVALLDGGGYAEKAVANRLTTFPIPDAVTNDQALALVLQGTTAWLLIDKMTALQSGETIVVHAGAGGVGSLAIQIARLRGAKRIIATASTPQKRALCERLGADVALPSDVDDLTTAIRDANHGKGVDVVLEMIGGEVFAASLEALAPFGRLATYGAAGRTPPPQVSPVDLMSRSRSLVGFWLNHGISRGLLGPAFDAVAQLVGDGSLKPVIGGHYPLAEARQAHRDLRARNSVGKLVLDVAN